LSAALVKAQAYPNLASFMLGRVARRIRQDGQEAFAHPVLALESFIDPQRFRGTGYRAAGWQPLGPTRGYQRSDQDFYEDTEHPKELWVRALSPRDLRVLRQTHWPETLRAPDAHPPPPACPVPTPALDSPDGHFQHSIPDPRDARGRRHALCSLLTLIALAVGAGCHGAQALAEFARSLNHPQRGGRGAADSLPLYEKRTLRRPRTLIDRFTTRPA
jgi:hypothetical protein